MDPNQYRRENSYYSFVSRNTASSSGSFLTAPGFTALGAVNLISGRFNLATDQALKLISCDLVLNSTRQLGTTIITALNFTINGPGTLARIYTAPWASQVLGAANGLHVSDEEWFFWNDYTEQGGQGLTGDFQINMGIDIQNNGVAADGVNWTVAAAVEFYEKQKLGLSGQQATLRTLREIEP